MKHRLFLLSAASLWAIGAIAQTEVSQTPLITAKGLEVKPNLLFVMDDSGSMAEEYLPEAADTFEQNRHRYGHASSQCNGLAFDAALAYPLPVKFNGDPVAAPSPSALFDPLPLTQTARAIESTPSIIAGGSLTVKVAWFSGISSGSFTATRPITVWSDAAKTNWMLGFVTSWNSNTRDLVINVIASNGSGVLTSPRVANNFPAWVYFTYKGTEKPRAYSYNSSGAKITTTTFYQQCNQNIAASSTLFDMKIVPKADAAEQQRWANWYTHYRTRMAMMKSVTSHSFVGLNDRYRIGYSTIHSKQAKEGGSDKFLNVRDFDATQKESFYSSFNAASPGGYTPNRAALAFAGRYFGRRARDQSADPVEYSCQKNFALLATDGAWNDNDEDSNFGPFRMKKNATDANVNVGQQDGSAPLGQKDTGVSNTLADVAFYYYNTDLRDATLWANCTGALGTDVCKNNAGQSGTEFQRMHTFALSLGQDGARKFIPNYDDFSPGSPALLGDYAKIVGGSLTWPDPFAAAAYRIDDLWHAAVNGGGRYFNAANPAEVTDSLRAALRSIDELRATGTAATTSSLYPVPGDDSFFVAGFDSPYWTGDVEAFKINTTTGSLILENADGSSARLWSAGSLLKARDPATRKVYYAKPGTTTLRDFNFSNLSADGLADLVRNQCAKTPASLNLSHCPLLQEAEKPLANDGANMVAYLRGAEKSYYRVRRGVLGDIVNFSPVYDGKVVGSYTYPGYSDFAAQIKSRSAGTVFVGSNDGMLHAFDAATGAERWAFIPSAVRQNLVKLADRNYEDNHRFFVDGNGVIADVESGGTWRRIFVFGLGAGGNAYIALDITDPTAPKLLWEFTNANLGNTHARPVVVKRASDGKWVVALPSGFNNVGDGKGRLFLVNAVTGAIEAQIATSEGSTSSPAGLGPVAAWIDEGGKDNTVLRFYAGDNLGNLWRFDTEGLVAPKNAAMRLAKFEVGGKPQPITTRPSLGIISKGGYKTAVIYVGTGRLVGLGDLTDTSPQSIYGVRDPLGDSGWTDVRGKLIAQSVVTNGANRGTEGTVKPVDWTVDAGWMVDLPDAGERINLPMSVSGNTLTAASNVPSAAGSCDSKSGGYSWLYFINVTTGSVSLSSEKIGNSMLAGLTLYQAGGPGGNGGGGGGGGGDDKTGCGNGRKLIITTTDGRKIEKEAECINIYRLTPKRVNWRELAGR